MHTHNANNNHLYEKVSVNTKKDITEYRRPLKCFITAYVTRKDGTVKYLAVDKENVHNIGGVDFIHYQGYTSTGTGTTSSISTATQGSNWLAFSSNSVAPAAGDPTLAGEIVDGNGLARAQCTTRTHTAGTNITVLSLTATASGAGYTNVQKCALFNASSAGVMNHEFSIAPTSLNAGDSITVTVTVTGG